MAGLEKSKEHISEEEIAKIENPELKARLLSIIDFYSDPKNKKIIEERNKISEKVIEYLNENLPLSYEERTRPFTI